MMKFITSLFMIGIVGIIGGLTHAGTISAQRSTGRYMTNQFWRDMPSNGDIVRALRNYTDFATGWGVPCSGVANVVYLNPTMTLDNSSFTSNTIYVFEQGDHTMSSPLDIQNKTCIAFLGKGSVRWTFNETGTSNPNIRDNASFIFFDNMQLKNTSVEHTILKISNTTTMLNRTLFLGGIDAQVGSHIVVANSVFAYSGTNSSIAVIQGSYDLRNIIGFGGSLGMYFVYQSSGSIVDSVFYNNDQGGVGLSYSDLGIYNSIFINNTYGVYMSQSFGFDMDNIALINNTKRFQIEQLGTSGLGVATLSGTISIEENNGDDGYEAEEPFPDPTVYNLSYSPGNEWPTRGASSNYCDYITRLSGRSDPNCQTQGVLEYTIPRVPSFIEGTALPVQVSANAYYSGTKIGFYEGINQAWLLEDCFDVNIEYPDLDNYFPSLCSKTYNTGLLNNLPIGSVIDLGLRYINTTPNELINQKVGFLGNRVIGNVQPYQTGQTNLYVTVFKSLDGQWEVQ